MRTAFLLALIGTPALTYALDDCSEQLAEIDKQLEATDEAATNIMLAMQMRQSIEQMCFMLDDETMSKMLEGVGEVLKTDMGSLPSSAESEPENTRAATRKSSPPKAQPGNLIPPEPTGRSLGARFVDRPDEMGWFNILGARFVDRPDEMGWFNILDMDMLGDNARVLYTSAPTLQQLGLPDWQQYVYVVEMTPDGQATQTMVTSKQAQDHVALALRRGHDEVHFQRGPAERGDPSKLELWSVSGKNRLSSAVTPNPGWPDGTKWDWQPFRLTTSDGNVLFSASKSNKPDGKSLIAWFEAKPNGDIVGQGSTVRKDKAGEGAWVETDNGGGGLVVRLSANDMTGIETRLKRLGI